MKFHPKHLYLAVSAFILISAVLFAQVYISNNPQMHGEMENLDRESIDTLISDQRKTERRKEVSDAIEQLIKKTAYHPNNPYQIKTALNNSKLKEISHLSINIGSYNSYSKIIDIPLYANNGTLYIYSNDTRKYRENTSLLAYNISTKQIETVFENIENGYVLNDVFVFTKTDTEDNDTDITLYNMDTKETDVYSISLVCSQQSESCKNIFYNYKDTVFLAPWEYENIPNGVVFSFEETIQKITYPFSHRIKNSAVFFDIDPEKINSIDNSNPLHRATMNVIPTQPTYVHKENDSIYLVSPDETIMIVEYPEKHPDIHSVSPDENYVAVTYKGEKRPEKLIDIISLDNPRIKRTMNDAFETFAGLSWSQDNKYVAIETGVTQEIIDSEKTGYIEYFEESRKTTIYSLELPMPTLVTSFEGKGLIWINNKKISHIFDKTLFTGTLSNPKQNRITDDVHKVFYWSPTERYIAFHSDSDSIMIYDTHDRKKHVYDGFYKFNIVPGEIISQHGWSNDNEYFFSAGQSPYTDTPSRFQLIQMPSGTVRSRVEPEYENLNFWNNVISDDHSYLFSKEYENEKNIYIPFLHDMTGTYDNCSPYFPDHEAFTDTRDGTWKYKNYVLLANPGNYMAGTAIRVYAIDITNCTPESEFLIDTDSYSAIMSYVPRELAINKSELPSAEEIVKVIIK